MNTQTNKPKLINNKSMWAGSMAQMGEHLASKHEALSLNSSSSKTNKTKNKSLQFKME
jgi:hypothetical protein